MICKFNLSTKDVAQPLSPEYSAELERMLQQSKQNKSRDISMNIQNQGSSVRDRPDVKKQIEMG